MSDNDMNQMQDTAEEPVAGAADAINEETAGQTVSDEIPGNMQAQPVKEDNPSAGEAAVQEGVAQEKASQESAEQGPSAWNASGQNGSVYQDANMYQDATMYQSQAGYQNAAGYQNGPSYGNQNVNTCQYGDANRYAGGNHNANSYQNANNYQNGNSYQNTNNYHNANNYQNPNAFQQGDNGVPNNRYPYPNVYGNDYGQTNGSNGYPYGGAYQESPYQGAPIAPISQEAPEPPMKVADWVLTLLVLSIPCVNLIMLFIWGFGTTENRSKANFCKAALIWTAVAAALGFILYMVIVAGIIAGLG